MIEIIVGIWLLLIPVCAIAGGLLYFRNQDDIFEGIIGGITVWFIGTIIMIPTIAGIALLLR